MWFLAWREIRHSPVKFALISALVALVAFLIGVMTGLASGLGAADVSGMRRLPGDIVVFSAGSRHDLSASGLTGRQLAGVRAVPGVSGVIPISFRLTTLHGRQVAEIGMPGRTSVSTAGHGSIEHAPVAYVPLASGQPNGFLVNGTVGPARIKAAVPGTDPVTMAAAIAGTPGYAAETGTVMMLRAFLYVCASVLTGMIFWVLTLEKEGPLAVLRATGARPRLLAGSCLVQVALTSVTGAAAGALAALALTRMMPAGSYALTAGSLGVAMAVLVLLALAGSGASLRRMLTIDPLLSLGRTA